MPATLLTPTPINAEYVRLYTFIQNIWEIAHRARILATDPTSSDAYTLNQTSPSAKEANILAVENAVKHINELQVKIDDAISELNFAINYLKDNARRLPPLPVAIGGPPFGVVYTETP